MCRFAIRAFLSLAVLFPVCSFAQSANRPSSSISTLASRNGSLNVTNRINNNPTVSPYLRLLQGNGGAASGIGSANAIYQTQVRPQLERRQQAAQQQQQIQGIQRDLGRLRQQYSQPSTGFMQTGHPTRFMSYSHYYPSLFGR